MPISSFSAKRFDELLSVVVTSDSVGLDTMRDIASLARTVTKEVDDASRVVVAWVLTKQIDAVCEKCDGARMTAEASADLIRRLRLAAREGLAFLNRPERSDPAEAVRLAAAIVRIGTP